jgi:MFS family permease
MALIALAPALLGGLGFRYWSIFFFGLMAGTFASFINLYIMTYFTELSLQKGKKLLAFVGMLARMVIYIGVLVGALYLFGRHEYSEGLACGIGAACGFLTYLIAIIWTNGIAPARRRRRERKVLKKTGGSERYIYDDKPRYVNGIRRHVVIRKHSFDVWHGSKHYITHKKFRILHEIRRVEKK